MGVTGRPQERRLRSNPAGVDKPGPCRPGASSMGPAASNPRGAAGELPDANPWQLAHGNGGPAYLGRRFPDRGQKAE